MSENTDQHQPARQGTLRQTLWILAETMVPAAIPLVVTPLVLRGLGADRYGLLLLSLSVASLGALSDMGLSIVGARELSVGRARQDAPYVQRVMSSLLVVYAALGAVVALFLGLFAPWLAIHAFHLSATLAPLGAVALRWAGLGTFLQLLTGLVFGFFRSAERFDITARTTLLATALGQCVVVWCAFHGDLQGVILGSMGPALLQIPLMFVVGWRSQRQWIGWQPPSLQLMRHMIGLAAYQFAAALFYRVGEQASRLLLTRLAGPAALGYYSIPFSLVQQLQSLVAAPAQLLLPRIAGLTASGAQSDAAEAVRRAAKLVLWVGVAGFAPLILCSRELLTAWLGAEFAQQATPNLMIFGVAGVAGALRMAYVYVLYGLGDTRTVMFGEAFRAATHIALLAILVPLIGPVGAAIAWLLSWPTIEFYRRRVTLALLPDMWHGGVRVVATTAAVGLAFGAVAHLALRAGVPHGPIGIALVLVASGSATLLTLVTIALWRWPFAADADALRSAALDLIQRLRSKFGR